MAKRPPRSLPVRFCTSTTLPNDPLPSTRIDVNICSLGMSSIIPAGPSGVTAPEGTCVSQTIPSRRAPPTACCWATTSPGILEETTGPPTGPGGKGTVVLGGNSCCCRGGIDPAEAYCCCCCCCCRSICCCCCWSSSFCCWICCICCCCCVSLDCDPTRFIGLKDECPPSIPTRNGGPTMVAPASEVTIEGTAGPPATSGPDGTPPPAPVAALHPTAPTAISPSSSSPEDSSSSSHAACHSSSALGRPVVFAPAAADADVAAVAADRDDVAVLYVDGG
mmetsp:Transcript_7541/g.16791  ORF Transcript_7541/g.16791 Transcript_7541/m.16791 type:complete len:278 (-) Transcript_7541:376-1209(-)